MASEVLVPSNRPHPIALLSEGVGGSGYKLLPKTPRAQELALAVAPSIAYRSLPHFVFRVSCDTACDVSVSAECAEHGAERAAESGAVGGARSISRLASLC